MPQLDSLRALAFFGVAASHWLPIHFLSNLSGPAVQLFFVLSGFLITGILLDYRKVHESNSSLSAGSALRTFYARRFLRIFPLFYGVIAVTACLNIGPIRELWPWHVSYTSNFLYAVDAPKHDPFSHFWSLALEEQFYLVWPFVVFFLPLAGLKRLTVALILFAPIFRLVMEHSLPGFHRVNYLPPSCGDSLGLGALLALATRHERLFSVPIAKLVDRIGLAGMVGGLLTAVLMLITSRTSFLETMGHTFLVLVFGWMVFEGAKGFRGTLGRLLDRPELQFMGKISYGLYVYHNFFTRLDLPDWFGRMGLPSAWGTYLLVDIFTRMALTMLLAVPSWYLFEKPLNNLKRHFTLRKKLAAPDVGASYRLAPGS